MASNSTVPIPVVATFASPFDTDETDVQSLRPSSRKRQSLWPGMYNSPVTAALWDARPTIFEALLDPPFHAPPQTQLLTKTPSHSRTSILYNFSSDHTLREQYKNPWNRVRIGKLLEDLDALAGTISDKVASLSFLYFLFSQLYIFIYVYILPAYLFIY